MLYAHSVATEALIEDCGATGLWQTLKRLQVTARAMHITAHPDDEDGGTLALLSRGQGVDVTLLSLNRGEAGANLVSGDFFDALGALRTAELMKAAQYYGARVRFTRFIDYGYSKTVRETFANWNKEDVLRDVVRIIRMERPHVLLARWQGTPRDGHGNHEAAGIIAQLAFEAAGDPTRFPEQIAEGLPAWQPLKLYSDNRQENDDWTVRVDSGVYDPLLGRTYAQMAREGLRHQRTQGAGSRIAEAGPSISYYKLLASKVGTADKEAGFFERTDVSLKAYPEVARHIGAAVNTFRAQNPTASIPDLAAALDALRKLGVDGNRDLEIKQRQLLTAIAQASGVSLAVLVDPEKPVTGPYAEYIPYETFATATPGQTFTVTGVFHAPAGSGVRLKAFDIKAPEGWAVKRLAADRFELTVPRDAQYSSAYWTRSSIRETSYRIEEPRYFGLPVPPVPVRGKLTYSVAGIDASLKRVAESSYIDAIGVQHRRALAVAPPVSVRFPFDAGVLPLGRTDYTVTCAVHNHVNGPIDGTLRVDLPAGWTSEPRSSPFRLEKENEQSNVTFRLTPPAQATQTEHPITAVAVYKDGEFRSSFVKVTQPGLETVYLARHAVHILRTVDGKVAPNLRAGYVMGTGDEVPEGLRQLGVPVEMLDTAALATGDLARYNTILLGIRAYAARNDVKTYNPRLLEYVKSGGVLVVQYNTQEYDHNYGPYPYSMTTEAEEVSEENSPVELLAPDDPVFHFSNEITLRDFDGWVEQRGSKFMTTWDPAYKALISTHDTGQPAQHGGWLVAKYGKGLYIYCAYAWYRQLPFAVPGAFRILANLVSLGAADAPWRR